MQGQRFLEKLRELAARLKRTRVVFPGYVTGERKRAFLALADLYVFPSRHESYGLTLMEALAAGLPAVCLDTSGARSVMREEFGALVPASGLRAAIANAAGRRRTPQRNGRGGPGVRALATIFGSGRGAGGSYCRSAIALFARSRSLAAAAAHLDSDIAQSRSFKLQPWRLAVIRTADRLQLPRGTLLKFLY